MVGQGKYVFISYSTTNQAMADSVRIHLLQNNIPCWMAPYDIPAGSKYAHVINDAVEHCACFLLLLTDAAQNSQFVEREVERAATYNKYMIPMQLEPMHLNAGFSFFLGNSQIVPVPDLEKKGPAFSKVIADLQNYLGRNDKLSGQLREEVKAEADKEAYNIDDELEAKFRDLFDTPGEPEKVSPLQKKIIDNKTRKFFEQIESRIPKDDAEEMSDILLSLVPDGYRSNASGPIPSGKHFTIPDVPGYKTIIFAIYKCIDYKTLSAYYICEPLDSFQQESSDGTGSETTYYVDDPAEKGNALHLMHFNIEKNEAMINSGMLIGNDLILSKTPQFFPFNHIFFDDSLSLSASAYDLDSLSEDERDQVAKGKPVPEESWHEASIQDNPTILIDPETALPVKRELYYDDSTGEWKARIKIKPCKSYISFQIRNEETNSVRFPLTDLKIAQHYKDGTCGFPKDVLKAAEYFEKDGSPEALYEIAVLFRTEPSIKDRDAYLQYLNQAVEEGCEEAAVELIADALLSSSHYELPMLPDHIDRENKTINFLLGYAAEKGILSGSTDTAFDYYYKAASGGCKPACARLGMPNPQKEAAYQRFLASLDETASVADYCMGCVLFFGLGMLPQKESGLVMLEAAAGNGNPHAAKALYIIYDSDSEFEDKFRALEWLKIVNQNDPSFSNELSNRLIDGIGCEICDQNDHLAFALLQETAKTGDKVAIHNLGWMYKTGRGCETDYELARQLFLKAEKANSYFHLGDMYEHGLGVPADFNIAVQYYEKGAAQGSSKAINRLNELKPAPSNNP